MRAHDLDTVLRGLYPHRVFGGPAHRQERDGRIEWELVTSWKDAYWVALVNHEYPWRPHARLTAVQRAAISFLGWLDALVWVAWAAVGTEPREAA
jgi:hypothetical protein